MKLHSSCLIIFLLAPALSAAAYSGPGAVTPAPACVELGTGVYDASKGLSVKTVIGKKAFAHRSASLPSHARGEAFCLTVGEKGVTIEANTAAGEFYARQALEQMLRQDSLIGCCTIYDYPRFAYRGIMLDISRHFRDKDFIIKQIDAMSMVRLNRLHLHLTDDAGWRLEIKGYPRLSGYAAWRVGRTWQEWRSLGREYATEGSPEASGGYLSQEDVREIVSYAAQRHVEVIPEIEMPGHSMELVAAYPELGCLTADGPPARNNGDVCPGREETFEVLQGILSEVMELFPSEYIHIGGDEASKRQWKECPLCLKRMQRPRGADGQKADELPMLKAFSHHHTSRSFSAQFPFIVRICGGVYTKEAAKRQPLLHL